MKRIVCVGNRYHRQDAAGSLVFDRLAGSPMPPEVEVIDGGLGGLHLLRFVEGVQRVVFVDSVCGFGSQRVVTLDAHQAAEYARPSYDHSAGLGYLLRVLPEVCGHPIPETFLVGIEGDPSPEAVAEAAELSLMIALRGAPAALRIHWEPRRTDP